MYAIDTRRQQSLDHPSSESEGMDSRLSHSHIGSKVLPI